MKRPLPALAAAGCLLVALPAEMALAQKPGGILKMYDPDSPASPGEPFTGKVRLSLTKNQNGICQLAGMELRLGRDTGRVDDYTTSVCTVTAAQMRQKPYGH